MDEQHHAQGISTPEYSSTLLLGYSAVGNVFCKPKCSRS